MCEAKGTISRTLLRGAQEGIAGSPPAASPLCTPPFPPPPLNYVSTEGGSLLGGEVPGGPRCRAAPPLSKLANPLRSHLWARYGDGLKHHAPLEELPCHTKRNGSAPGHLAPGSRTAEDRSVGRRCAAAPSPPFFLPLLGFVQWVSVYVGSRPT